MTVNTARPFNSSTGYTPLMVEVRRLSVLESDGREREGVGRTREGGIK